MIPHAITPPPPPPPKKPTPRLMVIVERANVEEMERLYEQLNTWLLDGGALVIDEHVLGMVLFDEAWLPVELMDRPSRRI